MSILAMMATFPAGQFDFEVFGAGESYVILHVAVDVLYIFQICSRNPSR
jgi:hypothetical protein